MQRQRKQGFTLIELLTVIAIIGVLAGLTFTVGPRMIEKAKLTKLDGIMRNVHTALVGYYATYSSYPPGYGYIDWKARQAQIKSGIQIADNDYYHLRPYLSYLNLHGVEDMHDTFSNSYDTNRDGVISRQEFSPFGTKSITSDVISFPVELYTGSNNQADVAAQLAAKSRPLMYVPVNMSQFKLAERYWVNHQDFHAKTWDATAPELAQVSFPPANYDAFVLISLGPREDLGGVIPEGPPDSTGRIRARDFYHIQGLRAYFLATRDMNQNDLLDFDFYARSQDGEAKPVYTYQNAPVTNELPAFLPDGTLDPMRKDLYGPVIKVYGK